MKLPLKVTMRTSTLQDGGQQFRAELHDTENRRFVEIYGYDEKTGIKHMPIGEQEVQETARFIERAVNCYDELVAALERIEAMDTQFPKFKFENPTPEQQEQFDRQTFLGVYAEIAHKALAKAKGEA